MATLENLTITPYIPTGRPVTLGVHGQVQTAGGTSQWEEFSRPRRVAGLEYTGTSLRTLTVPLMLNGIDRPARGREASIESYVNWLEALARPTSTTGEPPILRLRGPVPWRSLLWVVDDLQPDETTAEYSAGGSRVQLLVNVVFKEWQSVAVLVTEARGKGRAKVKTTTVVRADFPQGLTKVAARTLGRSSRWRDIARRNKNRHGRTIRDPRDIYVGQVLRLP
jgi:nucleoid-associated protein YgaU